MRGASLLFRRYEAVGYIFINQRERERERERERGKEREREGRGREREGERDRERERATGERKCTRRKKVKVEDACQLAVSPPSYE